MSFDHFKINKDKIRGDGSDDVGKFRITGSIEHDHKVVFVKKYIGKHSVNYHGHYSKEDKSIEGSWEVSGMTGAFKITKVGK